MLLFVCVLVGCSASSEAKKGNYIIAKEDNRILVAKQVSLKDAESKSFATLKKNNIELIYYIVEDSELYNELRVGEEVNVNPKTNDKGKYVVMQSDPPQIVAGVIERHNQKHESIMLDNLLQAMENQGLKLLQIQPKGGPSYFEKLNNVKSVTYAIDTYSMGDVTDEVEVNSSLVAIVNMSVYVFDSVEARNKGRKDLNDKLQLVDLASPPSIYENKNVLVVHFKYPDEPVKYDEMIQQAVKGL